MRALIRSVVVAAIAASLFVVPQIDPSLGAATQTAPSCSNANTTFSAATDHSRYLPGTPVRITLALHNRAATACWYVTGPTSPSFRVTNAAGVTVWGSCWAGGAPTPCADFLIRRTLAAGATTRQRLSWDQRSGTPDQLVAPGHYRFSASLQGMSASSVITLVRPRTITVGVADNARHYRVNVGDRIVVNLPTTGLLDWGPVQTSDPSVLAILPIPTPLGVTMLQARRAGVATITATGNPTCYPQCLMPSRLLTITVVVGASTPLPTTTSP